MFGLGIDSGSTTTKGVLFDGTNIIEKLIVPTGFSPSDTIKNVYDSLKQNHEVYTVTTGYGRALLLESDKQVTEITCHGKGANILSKGIRTIIDIGGQDSKVIILDKDGNICDFLMNDKCAAGTGRFIEVMMRILNQDINNIDDFIENKKAIKISSMCTVFAESEIISLLANRNDAGCIAMGIIDSIAIRTSNFAKRLMLKDSIFFSGGLASSSEIKKSLIRHIGKDIITHKDSQFTGAIGAASIAFNRIK